MKRGKRLSAFYAESSPRLRSPRFPSAFRAIRTRCGLSPSHGVTGALNGNKEPR